ncbi:MAG TPA: CDP-diacylglycerol--glycerol-3-phosphate 3-phosphatidyltransferase [Alphaproteobacteria bacterium]|nr:CDP-diacylglycerol--glycerol-3-phosphate 3-phosphatidyltransferase [Rhodospirillaceae bacterium]HRJ66523.1 CDP-diacylglycerol--glycerol-3-phosphate 3-phosphatidyltransferase [Alphaproteobacteria bacterium]
MSKPSIAFNIPNMLSYYRILVIPAMFGLFYLEKGEPDWAAFAAWSNVFLFLLAGLSDFLDGKIARATGQTTLLGKFLDSSTDKMLIGATLMALVAFDRLDGVWIIPAVVIFLREILIAGVREFMALYNVIVPISKMGKWKMTVQMFFIGFLLAGPYGQMLIPYAYEIGKAGFLFAMVITVTSGYDYMRQAWVTIQEIDGKEKQSTATNM